MNTHLHLEPSTMTLKPTMTSCRQPRRQRRQTTRVLQQITNKHHYQRQQLAPIKTWNNYEGRIKSTPTIRNDQQPLSCDTSRVNECPILPKSMPQLLSSSRLTSSHNLRDLDDNLHDDNDYVQMFQNLQRKQWIRFSSSWRGIYLFYILSLLSLTCLSCLRSTDSLLIRVRSREAELARQVRQSAASNNSNNLTISSSNNQNQNQNNNSTRNAKLLELDAFGYLQRYGYVNESMGNANLISEDAFSDAIMSFQRFAGIAETGIVDSETVKFMQMPRCGNKDMSGKGENGKRKRRRKKRYALQGSKWRRQELTYRISQYPTKFLSKKYEVDRQIEKAFKIWSQVAPIDFVVKQDGRVHIDIRFASGEHGDGDPFDGPGNTLAHAYFPQYGGDAHFDDQEYWTVDSYAGTNIFQVAAHELGHSLGLGHSSVREALMAPFYQKYKPNFKLHPDDVLGIQALYGERTADGAGSDGPTSTSTTSSTTTTTSTTQSPSGSDADESRPGARRPSTGDSDDSGWFGSKAVDLCQDSAIDAITRTEDGNTYVFRGNYYWQIKNEGLASGYPAKISRDWDGLPGNLDAALTWSDGKTFFFKGDKYWRFFNKRREPGYPKQISVGFAGIPNNVDAAFVWGGNGKTYFFKRDKYWRFDSKQDPPVSSQYPKSIRNWGGLPANGIDAAFKWENGMTYFFKDDIYYRFDDREFEVDSSARPQFPRSTAEWWFGCTNSNLPLRRAPTSSQTHSNSQQSASTAVQDSDNNSGNQQQQARSANHNQNQDQDQLAIGPSIKPRGNSISRLIVNSLSALFPSSLVSTLSSTSSSAPSSNSGSPSSSSRSSLYDDWSFHRGLGEEVNRVLRTANGHTSGSGVQKPISFSNQNPTHKIESSLIDNSRWAFPLDSSRFKVNREESLSELRVAPEEEDRKLDSANDDGTSNPKETHTNESK